MTVATWRPVLHAGEDRFHGTIQRECTYRDRFTAEAERALAIALYVACYNARRPHIALERLTPLDWLRRRVTKVSGRPYLAQRSHGGASHLSGSTVTFTGISAACSDTDLISAVSAGP